MLQVTANHNNNQFMNIINYKLMNNNIVYTHQRNMH